MQDDAGWFGASGGYYVNGDLGIMYVINQPGDTRFPTVAIQANGLALTPAEKQAMQNPGY